MALLNRTLEEILGIVGQGEIVGDSAFRCREIASLELAAEADLSFVRDRRGFDAARSSTAGALLVPERVDGAAANQLVVENPDEAFRLVLESIARSAPAAASGVHASAVVMESAALGERVTVGPGAVIEAEASIGEGTQIGANVFVGRGSRIGARCELSPNVVVGHGIAIGDRVRVHAGSVIGADGYGYRQESGRHVKVPQVGEVRIESDVEIGALVTIDRATIDGTVIGRGTKIGDSVHIGHNCVIGEDVLILPTVALSGSVRVGDGAVLAGRAGARDNVTIGPGAVLAATSVALSDVPAGATMWGNPARDMALQKRIQATLPKLPEMRRRLKKLEGVD